VCVRACVRAQLPVEMEECAMTKHILVVAISNQYYISMITGRSRNLLLTLKIKVL
jgi:hypothetical protein